MSHRPDLRGYDTGDVARVRFEMSVDRLWISDSSPLFVYSPGDQFGNDNAQWTTQLGNAANVTAHQTSGPAGALVPSIYTSGFTPTWQDTNEYTVQVSVNNATGQSVTSGSAVPVDYGQKSLLLAIRCSSGACARPFSFQGAWIALREGSNGEPGQSAQIDDPDSSISYTGFQPVPAQQGSVRVTDVDFGHTLSSTTTEGAQATVVFKGASVAVYGVVGPSLGAFTINIDGTDQGTWPAASSIEAHGVVLYFGSNLDPSAEHTLKITAVAGGNNVGLVLDSFIAFDPQGGAAFGGSVSPSGTGIGGTPTYSAVSGIGTSLSGAGAGAGTPNGGVIAGAILGSILGLLLLIWAFRSGVFVVKKKDKKMDPWDEANMLQKQKNEAVHVTTVGKQRYVYPGLIAHSQLKKF